MAQSCDDRKTPEGARSQASAGRAPLDDVCDAETLNREAMQLGRSGKLEEAVVLLRRAVELNPNGGAIHNNLGNALAELRRFDLAAASYLRAIALWPIGAQPHHNLASCLAQQGRFADAITYYERALRLEPDYPGARFNLAMGLRAAGRFEEAEAEFRRVIRAEPRLAKAHLQLGATLAAQRKRKPAFESLRQAIRLAPDDAEAYVQLGAVLKDARRFREAVACFRRALRLRPAHCDTLNQLGMCLTNEGKHDQALDYLKQAFELSPGSQAIHCNLGIALAAAGRLDEAVEEYGRALEINPEFAEVHNNLGSAYASVARYANAIASYDRALEAKPDYPDAHRNRSLMSLLHGDFAQGWREFEWRWKCRDFEPHSFSQPAWDGSRFDGKTILLHAEQGLGDTIQFIRYVPLVKARGGQVAVRVPRQLVALLRGAAGVDRLVTNAEEFDDFDVQLPMLSLPLIFQTTLETIPADVPYLSVDEGLAGAWRRELEAIRGFRVGIAWQGNPRYPADRQRSIPLAHFAALADVPHVRLISLQKGPGLDQLLTLADKLLVTEPVGEVDRAHGRFMDTAAMMKNLDLVITSDSAVAHLAGALGVPTWVALPTPPDWRWLLDREDSPWYPSMRLFRQTSPGDWDGVFRRIGRELSKLARQRTLARKPKLRELKASPLSLNDMGVQLAESGKLREAILYFRRALWLDTRLAEAHYNLGSALHRLGRFQHAAASFRRCLGLSPRNIEALCSLGATLACLGELPQAEEELRLALKLMPVNAELSYSLGNVLAGQGKWSDALDCFQSALAHNEKFAHAHFGMANILRQQTEFEKALAAYGRALALYPGFADARRQRAITHLLLGDFAQGWRDYAAAANGRSPGAAGDQTESNACFDPTDHVLRGKTLLLTAGEDLRETLLLLRFAELARRQGAVIQIRCPGGHTGLVSGCRGVDLVLADGGEPSRADLAAPLTDLPLLVGSPEPEQAAPIPFLQLDSDLVERWRKALDAMGGFRVGVDWRCDARDGPIPYDWIDALAEMPGLHVVRLGDNQRGFDFSAPEEAPKSALELAALIANLDLVVATDGIPAHLAGALGIPLFAILPSVPEWHWSLGRDDTPWFPTARLFRQSRRGSWDDVCEQISTRICHMLSGEPQSTDPCWTEADALCSEGAALMKAGDWGRGLPCFERAAHIAPDYAAVYNKWGEAYAQLGRNQDAAGEFRASLKRRPFYPEALLNLGAALAGLGEHDTALRHFRQAARLRPEWARAHFYIGNSLRALSADVTPCWRDEEDTENLLAAAGRQACDRLAATNEQWREALANYQRAAKLDPTDDEIQMKLASMLLDMGRFGESTAILAGLLRRSPEHVGAMNNLAVAYSRQEQYAQAIELLQAALRRRPEFATAHNNLGNAWGGLRRYRDAIAAYQQALAINPDYVEAHNNLGIVLMAEGRYDEALVAFRRALELRPDYAEALNNRGIALRELGRLADATAAYERAVELKPDYAEAHLNLGMAYLLRGDLPAGWQEYEWRFKCQPPSTERFAQPFWDGSALDGRTLLIRYEQGLGDALQFIRFAALAKQRGARVIIRCPPRMIRILGRALGVDQLVADDAPLPNFDWHAPLLSLPRILGTTLETIPNDVPYLSAEPELVEYWGARIRAGCRVYNGNSPPFHEARREPSDAPFLVGVHWQGNPQYRGDRHRSFPASCFERLATIPRLRLISLQKGAGPEPLTRLHGGGFAGSEPDEAVFEFTTTGGSAFSAHVSSTAPYEVANLGPDVDGTRGAFMDTAAVMMNLDLVITSDTAVAHLAGALGRPVWVALPYSADWRWLLDRDDSPWYPTMRLYRQTARGDWSTVFERMRNDLSRLVRERR